VLEQDNGNDPEDLADFIDYITTEVFQALPDEVQSISYSSVQNDPSLARRYADPIPASTLESLTSSVPLSVLDSLATYNLLPAGTSDLSTFLNPILRDYITSTTAAPPPWLSTKTTFCEICERDWIPLTYHHLIPRGVHAKVLKRGWHEEWMLNSVAWLCRACHTFVHRMAGNEELAKDWYTVDKILEREDVQVWRGWVGKVRWKAR